MGSNPMFPIILYNFYFSHTVDLININTKRRSLTFYIKYVTKIHTLIKLFKKINFINNYQIVLKKNKFFLKISPFYYKNINLTQYFKLISTPTKFYYISLKSLNLLRKRSGSSIYLLSTSKGIITHH